MEFAKCPQGEWKAFRNVAPEMKEIRDRCRDLIKGLSERCSGFDGFRNSRFVIVPLISDENAIADIKTPFGSGRAKLAWKIEDGALVGVLRFELHAEDKYGKQYWKLVWALVVPRHDDPYSAKSEEGLHVHLDTDFEDDRSNVLFSVLVAVFYGFAGGDLSIPR